MSTIESLKRQYTKCFKMLRETISVYDSDLWIDAEHFESPAWQIVYHLLYNANRYLSPSESTVVNWPKENKKLYKFFSKQSELTKEEINRNPYSKDEMLEYLAHIKDNMPSYLERMQPDNNCWPSWYDENQLEFQINNIRHIQHHIGQLNERLNNLIPFDYWWFGK
jgi:hypothetical protein